MPTKTYQHKKFKVKDKQFRKECDKKLRAIYHAGIFNQFLGEIEPLTEFPNFKENAECQQ